MAPLACAAPFDAAARWTGARAGGGGWRGRPFGGGGAAWRRCTRCGGGSSSVSTNSPTMSMRPDACPVSSSEALAVSSLVAAFCWVSFDSSSIERVTWVTAWLCASEAVAISFITSPTRPTWEVMLPRFSLTSLLNWTPSSAFFTAPSIICAVTRAASALRIARLRTSSATTAKPLPASPARAASTAAFSARRFVWKAISSMVFTIFAVSSDDALIFSIDCESRRMLSARRRPRCAPTRRGSAPPASCARSASTSRPSPGGSP